MNITKEDLELWLRMAYEGTCHQHNSKNNIDDVDIGGIYEMLKAFEIRNPTKRPFKLYPIHIFSDGGIRNFNLICQIGSYKFLLAHWKWNSFDDVADEIPTGFDPFLDWLYEELRQLPTLKIEEKLIFP